MGPKTIPPLLIALAIVAATFLAVLDKITGDVAIALIAGLIGGTFVPSPLTKAAE